jgi:hypothetical protein
MTEINLITESLLRFAAVAVAVECQGWAKVALEVD